MKTTACLFLILIYGSQRIAVTTATPCSARDYGKGSVVCVCNISYCDTIEPIEQQENVVSVIESSKTGLRFNRSHINLVKDETTGDSADITITFDSKHTFQKILGFGLAFTDASGISTTSLGPEMTQTVIDNYFSKRGLEYSMARITIGGTDFSTRKYTYDDDNDLDFELKGFSLQPEDQKYKIPLIQAAAKTAVHEVKLFGSAWSAPAWMKTNRQLDGMGHLIGKPGGEYYSTWARYYVKFLEAYRNHSIELWGLTTGNEPLNGFIPYFRFNCMAFTPWNQRDFIKKDLGPTLQAAGFGDIKLMILDDQRLFLPTWADIVLNDAEAAKYVSGIAYHWYWNKVSPAQLLDLTRRKHPNIFLLPSEATIMGAPVLGRWEDGEEYAKNIVTDLEHYATGWIDWNYALDLKGGPTWAKNYCSAPIIVNASAGEFYKQPTFYALGHVAKFLPPGSERIKTDIKGAGWWSGISKTGFVTPDGRRVLIIVNTENEQHNVRVKDVVQSQEFVHKISERSFVTFVF